MKSDITSDLSSDRSRSQTAPAGSLPLMQGGARSTSRAAIASKSRTPSSAGSASSCSRSGDLLRRRLLHTADGKSPATTEVAVIMMRSGCCAHEAPAPTRFADTAATSLWLQWQKSVAACRETIESSDRPGVLEGQRSFGFLKLVQKTFKHRIFERR